MERQYMYRARRSMQTPHMAAELAAKDTEEKPRKPKRSPATASPYRTPIAAASFYASPSPSRSKRIPSSDVALVKGKAPRITTEGDDDSRDEIDFLTPPQGLHDRMRSREGDRHDSVRHVRTSQPTQSISVDLAAMFVNTTNSCQEEGLTLVSFREHMTLFYQNKDCVKIAWRDVISCKLGGSAHAMIALDIVPHSTTGKAISSLCADSLHDTIHLFLCPRTGEPNCDSQWKALCRRIRDGMQTEILPEPGSKSMYESLVQQCTQPFHVPGHTVLSSDSSLHQITAPTPARTQRSRTTRATLQKETQTIPIDVDSPPASPVEATGAMAQHYTRTQTKAAEAEDAISNEPILRYPAHGPFAVTLLRSDVRRLNDEEFLNDTLIEFGLRYQLEQIKAQHPTLADQIYVFNTFFYHKLTEFRDRSKSYDKVRKWTHRVNMYV